MSVRLGHRQAKIFGDRVQPPVAGPQPCAMGQGHGCQQVGVDIADSPAVEPPPLDEGEFLVVVRDGDGRKLLKEFKNRHAVGQASAGNLADHERMYGHDTAIEQAGKLRLASAQVVYPDRGVDQYQGVAR